jgi:hypothetical protein
MVFHSHKLLEDSLAITQDPTQIAAKLPKKLGVSGPIKTVRCGTDSKYYRCVVSEVWTQSLLTRMQRKRNVKNQTHLDYY